MKVIDISMTIRPDMEMYPGEPGPVITRISKLESGDPYNVSQLTLGTHTGTHVDPPLHFIEGGAGIDDMPMDMLVGPARVIDLSHSTNDIGPEDIGVVEPGEIVLLKGKNGGIRLTTTAAQYLVDSSVKTVGTDALSIGTTGEEYEVHTMLLGADIAVIEGLVLSAVEAGQYLFACLPLKVEHGDGGPARAILIKK
ncbi:MAG: cyclase family protein [Methanosarcinales archaeon]|nr:cyclase family protein [Methanosarcinales archaeon]